MKNQTTELYIGDSRVNIQRSEAINKHDVIALEPKALKVLLLLVEKTYEIVSYKETMNEIWPGVVVPQCQA